MPGSHLDGVPDQLSYLPFNLNERKLLSPYLGQVSELVGIQQQLLQTPSVAKNLIGHIEQGAVAFIDRLDMTVAPPQGYTVKHHGEGGNKSRTRAIKEAAGRRRWWKMQQIAMAGQPPTNTSEAKLAGK